MKKFTAVIIGLILGGAATLGVLQYSEGKVAYGAINVWDKIVASSESLQWKDIFSPAESGQNLYTLVYEKQLVNPEEDALTEVAKKYGLTKEEAKVVAAGSLTPLVNNPLKRAAELTQEDAFLILQNLQEDFAFLKEVYQMQNELDLEISPSEIFANNELGDSGFDLVHDLSVIEEILFVDIVPNTVGKTFGNQLKKPYLVTDIGKNVDGSYVPNEGASAVLSTTVKPGTGSFKIGEKEVALEVLEGDLCEDNNAFADALSDFTKEAGNLPGEGDLGGINEGNLANVIGGGDEKDFLEENGGVKPAPADNWLKEWCPGTAAGVDKEGLKAQLSICLSTKFIKKTVSSYQPGKGCVLCEVEEINDLMTKTLSHSLVPNKVAGNFLESAKCKDAYEPLLDMKFITIAAPLPTPSNDDIVYGKNIFEEWKKFTDRYKPVLFPRIDQVTKFQLAQSEGDTQESVLNSVNENLAKGQAEALMVIEGTKAAEEANNTALYGNQVLGEMKLMTEFFRNYMAVYENIYTVCKDIKKKPDID